MQTYQLPLELIFEVILHRAGNYSASCLNAEINTAGGDLEELHDNISSAVDTHYGAASKPEASAIHLVLFQE